MRRLPPRLVTVLAVLCWAGVAMAQDAEWIPVTGADALRDFMSGLTAERELPSGEIARGEYAAEGTGVLQRRAGGQEQDGRLVRPGRLNAGRGGRRF